MDQWAFQPRSSAPPFNDASDDSKCALPFWRSSSSFVRGHCGHSCSPRYGLRHHGWASEARDRSFADKLGLQKCQVSIPLSPSEAVEIGRKWEVYPDPEKDPDWMKMLSMQQSGDQLRLVSCSEGNPYFNALTRNGEVIYSYLLPVLDWPLSQARG
ncbi:hypothetical protein [Stenotrophomonas sp. SAU14A_NAIMI4_5]|uniref:hypothetical protein n=1 Tax=Stenotrophomonas sp. SAU14A_NAIMI4_5 TaxID=2072413 RepID=UPI00131F486B|nr:hypothetical protein [Stenotrophomonas sp. SAU14A_NAIMI4_5]